MKTLQESIDILHSHIKTLPVEVISIFDSVNRVIARDLFSAHNIPPFNKSAMDGYACKAADLANPLKVIDYIPAGTQSDATINTGQCAKIMTGAPVPNGADNVIMIEHVDVLDDGNIQYTGKIGNANICYCGEDLKVGDLVMTTGTLIQSPHLAVLASIGITQIEVFQQPRIAVLSTGSELIEPGNPIQLGQIYNSNGHQLFQRIKHLGFTVNNVGIVDDDFTIMCSTISQVLTNHDVIIISGGVSVGDLDLVPKVFTHLGFDIHLTEMLTKPGKHTLFASKNGQYVLGLPGNPVSSYVQLETVGLQLLYGLMGHRWSAVRMAAKPAKTIARKNSDRLEFIPVRFNHLGEVEKIEYHGSAHIHALTFATALLEFPIGIKQFSPSDLAYVRCL